MIYVISKSTFGSYNVRDIQCNANWDCCPYSDYALIPDILLDGILATKGYCDITLNSTGTAVTAFTARTIPSVPEECCGEIYYAPAGYGLGETSGRAITSWAEFDAATENGWYFLKNWTYGSHIMGGGGATRDQFMSFISDFPEFAKLGSNTITGHIFVHSIDENSAFQEFYPFTNGVVLRREKVAGVWQPFEWVNPLMKIGREYRTTERWNGKPVYCRLVNCGVWAEKTIEVPIGVSARIIRFNGWVGYDGQYDYAIQTQKVSVGTWANPATIEIHITDTTSRDGTDTYVAIYYIKS